MAQYSTAADIINSAAVECGLATTADPYATSAPEFVQLRTLLTNCGQELLTAFQWQQLVKLHTINTGPVPVASGEYALPDDFNYMINQTGWTPANIGLGLPLGGPMSEQTWAALVASNLASSTIYVSFKISDGLFKILPAPGPVDVDITFYYQGRGWVRTALGVLTDSPTLSTDTVLYDRLLVIKMLAMRYKQAKGLDANSASEQFQTQFAALTGVNTPGPILLIGGVFGFPYLNAYINTPQTGFGF